MANSYKKEWEEGLEREMSERGRYTEVLAEVWPLLAVGFVVSCFRCWNGVKRSYVEEHLGWVVLNICFSSGFMAVMAVGMALLMPLMGIECSPEVEVGVVALLSGMGMKAIDAIIRRKAGLEMDTRSTDEKE